MSRDRFSFWCPLEITKGQGRLVDPTTGEEIMRLGGIASTSDKDADGEFLDPQGFDIKPLLESGMVNWHHQAKGQPATIIGEPTKAEIRKEGLYIETDLYASSQIAHDVWELAKTLEHDSKTRRLGYSIEGKVVKRKSDNPKDPGYKHIDKAIITGVAITHMPKNPKTFANIIKGEIDDELEDEETTKTEGAETEEKSLDTETGAALKRESLLGAPKFLTKGEAIDRIFRDIPGISIEKSEKVYSLIKSISMAQNKKEVTEEDIQKAYETLGLTPEVEVAAKDDIQKGEEQQDAPSGEDEETEEKKTAAEKKEDEPKEKKEGEDENEEEVKKGGKPNRFDEIEKAIAEAHGEQKLFIKALGVMMKDSTQRLEKAVAALDDANAKVADLENLVKAQGETISSMSDALESFGSKPIQKAAVNSNPVDRHFEKGGDDELNGKKQYKNEKQVSMSLQKGAVVEILDQASWAEGKYDEEFGKACMTFEASGVLPSHIIERIKSEYGFEIIK